MASSAPKAPAHLALIFGEDDFAVKRRAKQLYKEWTDAVGGMDHEIIDGGVANSGEALKVIRRLREGLQTLPFFGTGKVVWLQNCNFLGDERAAMAEAVTEALVSLAAELKSFTWDNVRLLISAGKTDKRKTFFKTLDKLGTVEEFAGWSVNDKGWADQAELWARKALRARNKEVSDEALAELVNRVGPNARQLDTEVEKVSLYVGDRATVEYEDVAAICTRNKTARAFALGDALGNRDVPELLRRLDEELWEVKLNPKSSEIGLLYGLISKVRALLFVKEMIREGWLKQDMDYPRLKAQLDKLPKENFPADKRFNPLAINPYVLMKAMPQARKFTTEELVRAMEVLLRCNQRLVSSSLDEALVLQQALVEIASGGK
jgi:DNA polymerase-3 subunit delta